MGFCSCCLGIPHGYRLVVPNGFVGCFGTESINAKDKLSEMAPWQELFKTPALQLTNVQVEC